MTPLPQSVLDHIASGRKIEAIKEVRALTGWDLRDAKEAVERIAEGEPVVLNAMQRPGHSAGAVDPDELAALVGGLVQDGKMIQAIKELRSATGLGLREAKEIVDRVAQGEPLGDPNSISTPRHQSLDSHQTAPRLAFVALGVAILLSVLVWLLAA